MGDSLQQGDRGIIVRSEMRFVGLVSVVLALVTVLGDALALLPYELIHVRTFWFLVKPLAAKMVICVVGYGVLWLILRVAGGKSRWDTRPRPLSVALAIFVAVCYRLYGLDLEIELPSVLARGAGVAMGSGIVAVGLVFAAAGYYFVRFILRSQWAAAAGAVFLAAPFMILASLVWVWLNKCMLEGLILQRQPIREKLFSASGLPVNIGYVVVIVVIVVFFVRCRRGKSPSRLVGVLALLIFGCSALVTSGVVDEFGASTAGISSGHGVKRVVFIVVDTLRADALSCLGGEGVSTSGIDRLAGESIVFEQAYAPTPWTIGSLSSIMTGLSALVHNTTDITSNLPDEFDTLAERMQEQGYLTWAIGSNLLVRRRNLEQGFAGFDFFPRREDCSLGGRILARLMPVQFASEVSTNDITDRAICWLQDNDKKDFFLWLHYFDPHGPYTPPEEYLPNRAAPAGMTTAFDELADIRGGWLKLSPEQRKWVRALYDSEVRYVDKNVGRLLEHLRQAGLYEDSLIVLTSDHGDEFWEHDGFDHGHSLYNELLRVPLMIKLPGHIESKRVSEAVSLESVMPTILDICGIEYDRDYQRADALVGYWSADRPAPDARPIVGAGVVLYEEQESVVFDGMKYISFLSSGREELYDLVSDPGERLSVLSVADNKAQEARVILQQRHQEARRIQEHYQTTGERTEFDSDTAERLRALGYVR